MGALDDMAPRGHHAVMGTVHPLPSPPLPESGEVFADQRGEGRSLRVAWHGSDGVVVLSLWRYDVCTATFRMPSSELPDLLRALTDGPLADQ